MAKEFTAEQVYDVFRKAVLSSKYDKAKLFIYEKTKSKDDFNAFILFAQFINRNAGMVDINLYVYSLIKKYEGFFDPKLLTARSSVSIYKEYIAERNNKISEKSIENEIQRSIRFITEYCRENEITFYNYFGNDIDLIPTFVKHIYSGSVSYYYVACIDCVQNIFDGYPRDWVEELIPDYKDKIQKFKARMTGMKDLKKYHGIENKLNELTKTFIKKENAQ